MSVRIIRTIDGAQSLIKVAGRLQSVDISELDKEVRLVDGPFVLDLSELQSADQAGIERLRKLASGRAELRGASRYVQILLNYQG